jgi:hypothetical protein
MTGTSHVKRKQHANTIYKHNYGYTSLSSIQAQINALALLQPKSIQVLLILVTILATTKNLRTSEANIQTRYINRYTTQIQLHRRIHKIIIRGFTTAFDAHPNLLFLQRHMSSERILQHKLKIINPTHLLIHRIITKRLILLNYPHYTCIQSFHLNPTS